MTKLVMINSFFIHRLPRFLNIIGNISDFVNLNKSRQIKEVETYFIFDIFHSKRTKFITLTKLLLLFSFCICGVKVEGDEGN